MMRLTNNLPSAAFVAELENITRRIEAWRGFVNHYRKIGDELNHARAESRLEVLERRQEELLE